MFVMDTAFFMLLSPTAEKVTEERRLFLVFIFLSPEVFDVHFLPAAEENEPKERRTGGEVSFAKKQTSRIFAPFNILPLVDPPLAVEGG